MPQQLQAILFDWAGTTVDYGSRAPAQVFQEIFRRSGVEITVAEAREPMGRAKRDHIATVLAMPRVAAAWQAAHALPRPTPTSTACTWSFFRCRNPFWRRVPR